MYLDKINMFLDNYTRIDKYKLKFKCKSWITLAYKSLCLRKTNCLESACQDDCRTNYKKYRNVFSTLMEKSKEAVLINILKEIGTILRAHGKESNPLFF